MPVLRCCSTTTRLFSSIQQYAPRNRHTLASAFTPPSPPHRINISHLHTPAASASLKEKLPTTATVEEIHIKEQMASATSLDFYSYKPLDKKGEEFDLSQLKGKVVLIVNVASKCGFTPQYEGLEKLYAQYQDQGLVVLGFPCNQFGGQAPGTSEEQVSFCTLTYGVKFPVLGKIDVNGDKAHPLYEWLKKEKPGLLGMKRIKWNFEKFLISRDGKVVERWASTTTPASLTPRVEEELKKSSSQPDTAPVAGPSDSA
ncbi:hypothetical protein TWF481_005735 [Arthrobotrys musiformis]|uniref:Glutathione peroxidase n=1 Tax=Arthrobotrys musiformis TaxID=47236 RepID=A0AAV9WF84_9PEZI